MVISFKLTKLILLETKINYTQQYKHCNVKNRIIIIRLRLFGYFHDKLNK